MSTSDGHGKRRFDFDSIPHFRTFSHERPKYQPTPVPAEGFQKTALPHFNFEAQYHPITTLPPTTCYEAFHRGSNREPYLQITLLHTGRLKQRGLPCPRIEAPVWVRMLNQHVVLLSNNRLPVLSVSPPRQQTRRYTVRVRRRDRRSDMHGCCSTKRRNRRAVARHVGVSPCFKRRRPLQEAPGSGGGADFGKAIASNLSTKSFVMPTAICIQ